MSRSRVTIKELYWEIDRDTYASNVWNGYKDIEVIPRKIVEMIIKKCEKEILSDYKSVAAVAEASIIKRYAEELLEQFEGDEE